MLKRLHIQNFAIIDEMEFEFSSGLNMFTGETGAGKSIVVEAISYLLGKPNQEDIIRQNQPYALIEGVFDLNESQLTDEINSFLDDSNELIILRKISRNSQSYIKINQQSVSLKKLKSIMQHLLNIVRQHEHLYLFQSEHQLQLLDAFGTDQIKKPLKQYQDRFLHYQDIQSRLKILETEKKEFVQRKEFLQFQIHDIEQNQFKADEEECLQSQKDRISKIDEQKHSLGELFLHFNQIQTHVRESLKLPLGPLKDRLELRLQEYDLDCSEWLHEIRSEQQALAGFEQLDIEQIESRLHQIFTYKKKYHAIHLTDLLNILAELKNDNQQLTDNQTRYNTIVSERDQLETQLNSLSRELHTARKTVAAQLNQLIQSQLNDLGFLDAQFEIKITLNPHHFALTGADQISFWIAPNAGYPLAPLQKIASGGELSRLMLAIRTVLIENHKTPTYIFDEVDTGVGGLTAIKIGEKLKLISKTAQLFCVTHLPQIAKFADHHFVIEKQALNHQTVATVKPLTPSERPQELKRMVGGEAVLTQLN